MTENLDIHAANDIELQDVDWSQRSAFLKFYYPSPFETFLTLLDWFGPPNGDPDPTKSQWEWLLISEISLINVYDWRYDTCSIEVSTVPPDEEKAERIALSLLNAIANRARRQARKAAALTKASSRRVLQNPYRVYYRSALATQEMAQELEAGLLAGGVSAGHVLPDSFIDYDKVLSLSQSSLFLFVAAFEGLLNLVYELYLRPELRDKRIIDRVSREQLDLKLRLAPLYCECYEPKPIPTNSEAFKDVQRIINVRNDFVHANMQGLSHRTIVETDGRTFVVQTDDSAKNQLVSHFGNLDKSDVSAVKRTIDNARDLIVESMMPRFRHEFRSVLDFEFIQVDSEDGVVIIVDADNDYA